MEINECVKFLSERDNYLLVTHARPDGDTLGSAAALCRGLRKLGKTAYLYPNSETTENYLGYAEPYHAPDGYVQDFTIAIDIASKDLSPKGYVGGYDLCVDHHMSNDYFARETFLMHAASCGEVVLTLLKAFGDDIDAEEATLLYIAVSTDTGCFAYGNTDAGTLRAAAELIDAGADNGYLNKTLFRTASIARVKLEGMIYSGLEFTHGGRAAIAVVTLDMLKAAKAAENDCEDLASLPGRVAGVKAGITIRENKSGSCKVSVRTTRECSADAICQRFGGGGHPMAGGCTIQAPPEKAKERLIAALDEVFA